MQSELDIVWKDENQNNNKPITKEIPVFQKGHKEKYLRALKNALGNGDISSGTYYKLRREYDE